MAYDPPRQRVTLFGGQRSYSSPQLGDTWEWDGSTWTLLNPVRAPSARAGHEMVYDPEAAVVVLHGGYSGRSNANDTWVWDGTAWHQRDVVSRPSPGSGFGLAIAIGDGRLVRFGADGATWLHGELAPAASAPMGVGCRGTSGIPELTGSLPNRGSDLYLDLLRARAAAPCILVLSPSPRAVAIGGGCHLFVGVPAISVAATTNAGGFRSFALPVPSHRSAIGSMLFAQAAVLDPVALLGVSFTGGRRLRIGD